MDLQGELVRLRSPLAGDAEHIAEIATYPDVARFAGPAFLRPLRTVEVEGWQQPNQPNRLVWTIVATQDQSVIGYSALTRINQLDRHGWFQITLGPPDRLGHGCGTEATFLVTRFCFRQLGMEKVYLGVFADNERGIRAYRKAGYEIEATLRRHEFREGELRDYYWMASYRDQPLYAVSNESSRSPRPPERPSPR